MNYTTLNKIRAHNPCADGWQKLLASLDRIEGNDDQLSLLDILDSNGLDDALWALRASDATDKDMRLYAVWCARQVQHLIKDQRSLDAIDVAERFANGEATKSELKSAWVSARSMESPAAWAAAYEAAYEAAWDAAYKSALDTKRDAQKARFIEVFCSEVQP